MLQNFDIENETAENYYKNREHQARKFDRVFPPYIRVIIGKKKQHALFFTIHKRKILQRN